MTERLALGPVQKSTPEIIAKGVFFMHTQRTKRHGRFTSRVLGLLFRVDREICMEPDEFAYRRGWTVARSGFGARRYHDLRFDEARIPLHEFEFEFELVGAISAGRRSRGGFGASQRSPYRTR